MTMELNTQGDSFVLRIFDRFDSSSYSEFKNICEQIFSNKLIKKISVDVSSLNYMDSSAMGMLMILDEKAEQTKKTVTLTSVPGTVANILKIANADKLFTINLPSGMKFDLRK